MSIVPNHALSNVIAGIVKVRQLLLKIVQLHVINQQLSPFTLIDRWGYGWDLLNRFDSLKGTINRTNNGAIKGISTPAIINENAITLFISSCSS